MTDPQNQFKAWMASDNRVGDLRNAFMAGFIEGWFGEGDLDKSMEVAGQEYLDDLAGPTPEPLT